MDNKKKEAIKSTVQNILSTIKTFLNSIFGIDEKYRKILDPSEDNLKIACIIFSALIWLPFILSPKIILLSCFLFFIWAYLNIHNAYLQGYCLKLNKHQFPKIYEHINKIYKHFDPKGTLPSIYIVEAGGFFTTILKNIPNKDYIYVSSSIIELWKEGKTDEFNAFICREIGHILSKHKNFFFKIFIFPSLFIPFLGSAYLRKCEYSADNYVLTFNNNNKEKTISALAILGTGKKLNKELNINTYIQQAQGFWYNLLRILSFQPFLTSRICRIKTGKPYFIDFGL